MKHGGNNTFFEENNTNKRFGVRVCSYNYNMGRAWLNYYNVRYVIFGLNKLN